MRVLWANIEDVWREAAARWTLVAYFLLSSIFIIIFAAAINLDIVDGALASAKLFGKNVQMRDTITIDKVIGFVDSGFAGGLFVLCTLMAIFATAHLVPRMVEKGTIDLYLSRPVSRTKLLLSRYVAGLLLVASNVVYLVGAIWAIVAWKTHVWHIRFLLSGAIILFVVATLLAFAFLVGVITSSTAVSIMGTYGVLFFSSLLAAHDRIAATVSHDWEAVLIQTMYWILPKTVELGTAAVAFVSGAAASPKLMQSLSPTPFLTTAAFGVGSLILATWRFDRKEF